MVLFFGLIILRWGTLLQQKCQKCYFYSNCCVIFATKLFFRQKLVGNFEILDLTRY